MRKKRRKRKATLISCLLILAGCGIGQSLNETTKKIDNLGEGIQDSLQAAKEGFSLDRQDHNFTKAFKRLEFSHKKKDAIFAINLLPFQSWTEKSEQSREELIKLSLEIFYAQMSPYLEDGLYYPDDIPFVTGAIGENLIWRDSSDNKFNKWLTLGAFASALNYIGEKQKENSKKNKNFKKESLYSIISQGLQFKEAHNRDEALPKWVEIVLNNEKESIKLLHFRNVISSFLYVYHIDEDKFKGLSKTLMIKRTFLNWDVSLKSLNRAHIDAAIEFLKEAKETREFLESIGEAPVWPHTISKIIQNVRFVDPQEEVHLNILFLTFLTRHKTLLDDIKESEDSFLDSDPSAKDLKNPEDLFNSSQLNAL